MPERSPELDALIRQAELAAAGNLDLVAALVQVLRAIIHSDADPYLLTNALAEAIAATVAERIPPEKQGAVALEMVRTLRDRLAAHGTI